MLRILKKNFFLFNISIFTNFIRYDVIEIKIKLFLLFFFKTNSYKEHELWNGKPSVICSKEYKKIIMKHTCIYFSKDRQQFPLSLSKTTKGLDIKLDSFKLRLWWLGYHYYCDWEPHKMKEFSIVKGKVETENSEHKKLQKDANKV